MFVSSNEVSAINSIETVVFYRNGLNTRASFMSTSYFYGKLTIYRTKNMRLTCFEFFLCALFGVFVYCCFMACFCLININSVKYLMLCIKCLLC